MLGRSVATHVITRHVWSTALLCVCAMTYVVDTALPATPANILLRMLRTTSAEVVWKADDARDVITKFRLFLQPTVTSSREPPLTSEVRGSQRHYVFNYLTPNVKYRITIASFCDHSEGNMSEALVFTTMAADDAYPGGAVLSPAAAINVGEVCIVVLMLGAWLGALLLFLHKWGRMRMLATGRDYSHRQSPKNIDTVKVVARSNDSVIYRNYSQQHVRTMQARENRMLQRMQTLPNIKINTAAIVEYKHTLGGAAIAEEPESATDTPTATPSDTPRQQLRSVPAKSVS